MLSYTFEVRNSRDLLRKLEEDYAAFCADDLSSSKALTCAMVAWHLTEWAFRERQSPFTKNDLKKYQEQLAIDHPFMGVMHDVANGAKHMQLTQPKTNTQSSGLRPGSHDLSHDIQDHEVAYLYLFDGQAETIFIQELEKAVKHWRAELR